MLRIKLAGHEYRYEVFQIASLFYSKNEIEFSEGDCNMESILDMQSSLVECRLNNDLENSIHEKIHIHKMDSKTIKNAIKMSVLICLEKQTGIEMPWGILVGIRPTKIIHEYLNRGIKKDEIIGELVEKYSLSMEKAHLVLEVAANEAPFLKKPKRSMSMYVGIPFCPTRCSYCSFTSNPIGGNSSLVKGYLESLEKEIIAVLNFIIDSNYKIDTLYMGGGTPTSISASQLDRLLDTICSIYDFSKLREFTIEAGRPDSIDSEKLSVIRSHGCSRISINPQTMNDETLKRIGRLHTSQDIISKFELARNSGFDNINMDIIIGLPGEGENEIFNTMKSLEALSPDNITIHTMAVKRASILNERDYHDSSRRAEGMYRIAVEHSRKMGMYPYYMYRQKNMVSPLENVGYCKKNMECIYNIQMIAENTSIVSFGADAITKIVFEDENRIERAANLKDVREYNTRINELIENKINALSLLTKND